MKHFFCISLFLVVVTSCKRKQDISIPDDANFMIELSISGNLQSNVIYLKQQEKNEFNIIDSAIVKNHKATFMGTIENPEIFGIFLKDESQGIFPIVEKGEIRIKAHIDSLSNAKIEGTLLNEQLNMYKKNVTSISSKINDLFYDFQKARAENNIDKLKVVKKKIDQINNELIDYRINFIRENFNSEISILALNDLATSKTIMNNDSIKYLYNILSDKVKESRLSEIFLSKFEID